MPDRPHPGEPADATLLASGGADAFTRDGEIAADLLAETFAAPWAARRRFRDERDGSAGPWLFAIARNQASLHARRGSLDRSARERIGMPVRDYGAAAYDEAEERLDSELLAPLLDEALADLSARDRRALELRVVDERSYDDIGVQLAITPAAARTRVYRALHALRASLNADPDHTPGSRGDPLRPPPRGLRGGRGRAGAAAPRAQAPRARAAARRGSLRAPERRRRAAQRAAARAQRPAARGPRRGPRRARRRRPSTRCSPVCRASSSSAPPRTRSAAPAPRSPWNAAIRYATS